jgi:mannose-6-phosphate isomerase-like protein (cupin superfamily)
MTLEEFLKENWPSVWEQYQGRQPMEKVSVSTGFLRGMWSRAQEESKAEVQDADTGPSGLIGPVAMKFVSKRWGWELWIVNNEKYCGKKLFVKQGRWLSYHYHEIKDEVLYVESGRAEFICEDENGGTVVTELVPGYAFHVKPGLKHQIHALEDTMIFEFSTKHMDSDSYRHSMELQSEQME